jgi:hypothetical protein
MREIKYKIIRLDKPNGKITHRLEMESMTRNKESGGWNFKTLFYGSWKECHLRKKEYLGG